MDRSSRHRRRRAHHFGNQTSMRVARGHAHLKTVSMPSDWRQSPGRRSWSNGVWRRARRGFPGPTRIGLPYGVYRVRLPSRQKDGSPGLRLPAVITESRAVDIATVFAVDATSGRS